MKVGIITFHASHNYGSMLQAYALQTFVEKLGHTCEVINYRSKRQKAVYPKPFSLEFFKHPRLVLKYLKDIRSAKQTINKWYLFESFVNRHLKTTREFCNNSELRKANLNYDVVISGSDQIWNTSTEDFSESYLLSFVRDSKKVAYAPSLGPNPSKSNLFRYTKLLQEYHRISVREQDASEFLCSIIPTSNVEICLDPTLLLSADDYLEIVEDKPIIDGKYVLFYAPADQSNSGQYIEAALIIAKSVGCKLVITQNIETKANVLKVLNVGPSEFLNLLKYAEIVCGRSFHMVVFSILFSKEFYTINSEKDARCVSVFNALGIVGRNYSFSEIKDFKRKNFTISEVQDSLDSLRKESYNFLLTSLS